MYATCDVEVVAWNDWQHHYCPSCLQGSSRRVLQDGVKYFTLWSPTHLYSFSSVCCCLTVFECLNANSLNNLEEWQRFDTTIQMTLVYAGLVNVRQWELFQISMELPLFLRSVGTFYRFLKRTCTTLLGVTTVPFIVSNKQMQIHLLARQFIRFCIRRLRK